MRFTKFVRDLPPAGIHLYPGGVSVVCTEMRNGAPTILGTRDVPVAIDDERPLKMAYAAAIQAALSEIGPEVTTCVCAPQPTQVVVRRFKVEPNAKERHIRSAAAFEADEACEWPFDERIMALDPLVGTTDKLLSVARRDAIDTLVETAREANLRPIAIDVPLAAWQRSLCDRTDALLDLTYERPVLYVFAEPLGEQRLLPPRLTVEKLAQAVRSSIVEVRRQRTSMVRRLLINGPYKEMNELLSLLQADRGLESAQLQFGAAVNPAWGFAAALATWSYAGQRGRKR